MKERLKMEKQEVKQEKRHHGRRVLLLFLLLLVTGVLLGTSSYAWFTSNKNVTISEITVNVAATNGIQISADAITWKSIISTTDLNAVKATTYTGSVNQIPSATNALSPVSTVGDIYGGKMNMFLGNIVTTGATYYLTAAKETEASGTSGKFIVFDLFVKIDTDAEHPTVPVYLAGDGSNVIASGGSTGIENAARVAFVRLGNTMASDSDVADLQGLTGATVDENADAIATPTASVMLWEPNIDTHTQNGVNNAINVYAFSATTTDSNYVAAGSGNNQLDYYGVRAAIADGTNIVLNSHSTDYFTLVEPNISTTTANTSNNTLYTLTEGVTKLRIYMWVEGQDVDCENNASGGSITYNIKLTTDNGA